MRKKIILSFDPKALETFSDYFHKITNILAIATAAQTLHSKLLLTFAI